MTVGCGKTARLGRDRLEAAQEQARLAELARPKGLWERFSNHVYNNGQTYFFCATAVMVVVNAEFQLYHERKKTVGNGNGIPYHANDATQQRFILAGAPVHAGQPNFVIQNVDHQCKSSTYTSTSTSTPLAGSASS